MPEGAATFNDLLGSAAIAPADVRLLRHATGPGIEGQSLYDLWQRDREGFELYQNMQKKDMPLFRSGRIWASFVSPEPDVTLFVGLYDARFERTGVPDWTCPYRGNVPGGGKEIDMFETALRLELAEHIGSLTVNWDKKSVRTWKRYAQNAHLPLSATYSGQPQGDPTAIAGRAHKRNKASRSKSAFHVGQLYKRAEIAVSIGLPEDERGSWATGYAQPFDDFFLFVNVGTKGRTGHDYPNRWDGSQLLWSAKTGTRLEQPQIVAMLSGEFAVHVFWRADDRAPFTYAGRAHPIEVLDTSPVRVRWTFDSDRPAALAQAASASAAIPVVRRGPPPAMGARSALYKDGPTAVYLLMLEGPVAALFPDTLPGRRIIKVGMSNDVPRRIEELSYGFPPGCSLRWTLVAARQFPSAHDAFVSEALILERLRRDKRWIGGEFAAVDEVDLVRLAELSHD